MDGKAREKQYDKVRAKARDKARGNARHKARDIPFTPPQALGEWAVATYGPEGGGDTIHLGNNGVHYVFRTQAT